MTGSIKTIREVKQINGYRTYSEYNRAKGLNKGTRKIQMVEIIIK